MEARLRLKAFRIENYRSIEDSGWIPVGELAALVGVNEAGKSALLRALSKLKPSDKEEFDSQHEFPRHRFAAEYERQDWRVVSAEFELTDAARAAIAPILDGEKAPSTATFYRYYKNEDWTCDLSPAPEEEPVSRKEIETTLRKFEREANRFTPDNLEEAAAAAARTKMGEVHQTLRQKLEGAADDLHSADGKAILAQMLAVVRGQGVMTAATKTLLEPLLSALEAALEIASKPLIGPRVEQALWDLVPLFIYFEDYSVVTSAIYLPSFLEGDPNLPGSEKRTINTLFRHVGLSAQDILELGKETAERQRGSPTFEGTVKAEEEKKHLRSVKLSSAGQEMTAKFGDWFKQQRKYRFRYHADGNHFRIWVHDDKRSDEIEVEARSGGFRWFFWFYLVFLVESEDGHKDAILLLDEPGLHLHPTAQKDLVGFLEGLAKRNQLIYSTHLPFLVNGEHLDRVRAVTLDAVGVTQVSTDTWPKDKDAVFPLQAALGYSIMQTIFLGRKSVLLEGMTDYWLFQALNPLVGTSGRAALPNDVLLVPGEGTKKLGYLASLFLSQGERPVIVLDADTAGRTRAKEFLKEQYLGNRKRSCSWTRSSSGATRSWRTYSRLTSTPSRFPR